MNAISPFANKLEAALWWARERGIYVFRVAPNGKEPLGGNGHKDATRDPALIREWWTATPEANIGGSLGHSGHFAIDQDGEEGAHTLAALELEHGFLPETLTIQTPRGKGHLHRIFKGRCPSSTGNFNEKTGKTKGLGAKCDTKGYGGYIVLPPSRVRYEDGSEGEYAIVEDREYANGPAWVAEVVGRRYAEHAAAANVELDLPVNIERTRSRLQQCVNAGDIAVAFRGGNDRTYRLSCEVLNLGLSPQRAWELIRDEWNPACEPPWDNDELAAIVAHAAEYSQNDIGCWAVKDGKEIYGHLVEKIAADVEAERQDAQPEKPRFNVMRYSKFSTLEKPQLLIQEFPIPKVGVGFFNSETESFKTFLLGKIGKALAFGKDFHFGSGRTLTVNEGCQGAVFNFLGEAPNGVSTKRIPALYEAAGVPESERDKYPLFIIDSVPLAGADEIEAVIAAIEGEMKRWPGVRVALVTFDTWSKVLAGMNMNESEDASKGRMIAEAVSRRFQCAVVFPHHVNADDPGRPHGSRTNVRDVDFDFYGERPGKSGEPGRPLCCKVRNGKDKDEGIGGEEIYFEMIPFAGSLVPEVISAAEYYKLARGGALSDEQRMLAALVGLGCYPEGARAATAGDRTSGCGQRDLARACFRLDGYARLPEGQKATAEQESAWAAGIERWRGKIASLTKSTRKKGAPLADCRVLVEAAGMEAPVARFAIVETRWDALGPLERASLLRAAQPLLDVPSDADDTGEDGL